LFELTSRSKSSVLKLENDMAQSSRSQDYAVDRVPVLAAFVPRKFAQHRRIASGRGRGGRAVSARVVERTMFVLEGGEQLCYYVIEIT
jgi:hypothetical protein